ncbi:V-type ATP synthase subunit D [Dactylosporangium sp. NPDC005555]|uniref:V-type ATP synthase subunit D n=1 Tax=Dactylosporangium sp. NPDC005555 TaxID=3154889 RepID=UPI0033A5B479
MNRPARCPADPVITGVSAVDALTTLVMGVRCAQPPDVRLQPPGWAPTGGAALAEATAAYRAAALAAARHAAAAAALRAVGDELARTRRRVRAVERHWVPRLEAALAAVVLQLAELEAGEAASRRATGGAAGPGGRAAAGAAAAHGQRRRGRASRHRHSPRTWSERRRGRPGRFPGRRDLRPYPRAAGWTTVITNVPPERSECP